MGSEAILRRVKDGKLLTYLKRFSPAKDISAKQRRKSSYGVSPLQRKRLTLHAGGNIIPALPPVKKDGKRAIRSLT